MPILRAIRLVLLSASSMTPLGACAHSAEAGARAEPSASAPRGPADDISAGAGRAVPPPSGVADAAPSPAQVVAPTAAFETVEQKIDGGMTLTADLWRVPGEEPKDAPRPVLVCFHATRSSRGEYHLIAPELVARGFHVLAVDLRYGGPGEIGNRKTKERTGTMNESWKRAVALLGREPTPIEAYSDFPAVLAWARELFPKSKLGLVGSSYSASLVMVWAAEHPKTVDAIFAFSPGEWIDGWDVAARAKHLATPCFFTCGSGGPDTEQAKKLLAKLATPPTVYLPADEGRNGLHGVGTLHMKFDADRAEIWKRLDAALAWLAPVRTSTPSPMEPPAPKDDGR